MLHCNVFFNGEVDSSHADMILKELGLVMMFADAIIDGDCFPCDLYDGFESLSIIEKIELYSEFGDAATDTICT